MIHLLHQGAKVRAALIAAAVATFCLCAGPAIASPGNYTWTGKARSPSWALAANWAGGTAPAPSSAVDSLVFPNLTRSVCYKTKTQTCEYTENLLAGLRVNRLQVDDAGGYVLKGEGFTIGSGGIATTNFAGSGGFALISAPLTLAGNQVWNISGSRSGGDGIVADGVKSPARSSLSVNLPEGGSLALGPARFARAGASIPKADIELGNVTVKANAKDGHVGGIFYLSASLNDQGGHSLTLKGVEFNPGTLSTGPVIASASVADFGTYSFDAALQATTGVSTIFSPASASFDDASTVDLPITGVGAQAGKDFSQLKSKGAVNLGGAKLDVSDGFVGGCPAVPAGQTDTLVSTTGRLTGTFANAPNGSVISTTCSTSTYTSMAGLRFRINYNTTTVPYTVTATALPSTTAASASVNAAPTSTASTDVAYPAALPGPRLGPFTPVTLAGAAGTRAARVPVYTTPVHVAVAVTRDLGEYGGHDDFVTLTNKASTCVAVDEVFIATGSRVGLNNSQGFLVRFGPARLEPGGTSQLTVPSSLVGEKLSLSTFGCQRGQANKAIAPKFAIVFKLGTQQDVSPSASPARAASANAPKAGAWAGFATTGGGGKNDSEALFVVKANKLLPRQISGPWSAIVAPTTFKCNVAFIEASVKSLRVTNGRFAYDGKAVDTGGGKPTGVSGRLTWTGTFTSPTTVRGTVRFRSSVTPVLQPDYKYTLEKKTCDTGTQQWKGSLGLRF